MKSQESSEQQEGDIENGQGKRIILDLDLNNPPPAENFTTSNPMELPGQGNGLSQGQTTNVVETDDDDDVEVISAWEFAEATRNSTRNPGLKESFFGDWPRRTDIMRRFANYRTAINEVSNGSRVMPAPQVPVPVPTLASSHVDAPAPAPAPAFICGICMDIMTEETSTKCGHIFCKTCIDAALGIQRKCPICRKKVKKRDTMRIYFPKPD